MERFALSSMKDKNFSKAANEIYLLTDYHKLQYPDYYKWFYGKNIPRVISKSGEIYFYLDGLEVVGLTILKKGFEDKICTFMVNPDYRKQGFSSRLLEDSFEFLGTDKPLITIPQKRLDEFSSIIDFYGWVEDETINDYYSPEIVFNKKRKTK